MPRGYYLSENLSLQSGNYFLTMGVITFLKSNGHITTNHGFLTREIGQKGPKSDIGQLDQSAILDKLISTLSILTSDLFVTTKAKGMKRCGPRVQPKSHNCTFKSVRK